MISLDKNKLIVLSVLGAVALIMLVLIVFSPEQDVRPSEPTVISAQLLELKPQDYLVQIQSFGRVQPHVTTKLIAQAGGRIIRISPDFRPGGHFLTGEPLAWIEDDEYRHSVTVARSQLMRARSDLMTEKAMFAQAKRDWERLNKPGKASSLTLRQPQLERAQSELDAMEARLSMAQLDLSRTVITAPYNGRLRIQSVDVGQVVSKGTVLAEIYADDKLEIRLPILFQDIAFLPEITTIANSNIGGNNNSGSVAENTTTSPSIRLTHRSDTRGQQWRGVALRTEAGLEQSSYQYHLVAKVIPGEGLDTPIVGQYLDATIEGKLVQDALVLPAGALYRNQYVWLVNAENRLEKRSVQVLWHNDSDIIIGDGLSGGERIVKTRLGYVLEGMLVEESPP